jgi:hypothetical protein
LYAEGANSAGLSCAIRPGDTIVIKGSPDSKMKTIVTALEKALSRQDRAGPGRGTGRIECFTG